MYNSRSAVITRTGANTKMSDERIAYYDNAKFILVTLVIIGHFVETFMGQSEAAFAIRFFIYSFHMPCFIFISGLFYNPGRTKVNVIFYFSVFMFMAVCTMIKSALLDHSATINIFSLYLPPWFMLALCAWNILALLLQNVNHKYLIVLFVVLSLLAGYDKSIGDLFAASRIIYFFPFFLAGMAVKPGAFYRMIDKKEYRIISVIFLTAMIITICRGRVFTHFFSPMLSGRNPYEALPSYRNAGFLFRALCYLIQTCTAFAFLCIIPSGRSFFTDRGARTIAAYSIHPVFIGTLTKCLGTNLFLHVITAIVISFALSDEVIFTPFKKAKNAIINYTMDK